MLPRYVQISPHIRSSQAEKRRPLAILPAGFRLRPDEIGPFRSSRWMASRGCYGKTSRGGKS